MALMPKIEKTPVQIAMEQLNDVENVQDKRSYLGMSIIGSKCHRYLQYVHYGCIQTKISSRIRRLFEDGHNAESQLKKELAKIGVIVTGDQTKLISETGHLQGHTDGTGEFIDDSFKFIEGKFLIEYKTHNQKSFDELKKLCVKKSKPVHYGQCVSYMKHLGVQKCLYVAKNKNNSEIYLEVIDFDEEYFDDLRRKEVEVITAEVLLPRIGNDNPTWFECKLCNAHSVCFGREAPSKDCRNCKHVDVLDGGKWQCGIDGRILTDLTPCESYKMGVMFNV
jgi:hypothetical protein